LEVKDDTGNVQPSAGSRKLMEILRAYRAELDPNNTQRTTLLKHAGAARFAWNWGLARRKQEYEETGRSSNAIEQHRQLNALKKTDFPWLYVSDREWTCDCGAIHDRDLNAAINLKNLATKLPRVPRKVTPVESDIRPTAVSLAASLKQEPSAESHGRFW
jgi:transposase